MNIGQKNCMKMQAYMYVERHGFIYFNHKLFYHDSWSCYLPNSLYFTVFASLSTSFVG